MREYPRSWQEFQDIIHWVDNTTCRTQQTEIYRFSQYKYGKGAAARD